MRRIRVTGGFSGEVEVELTDEKGQDMSAVLFKMGLVPLEEAIPAASSETWQTVTEKAFPAPGKAVLTRRPTDTHPLGKFWPHILVNSGNGWELVKADDYVELT